MAKKDKVKPAGSTEEASSKSGSGLGLIGLVGIGVVALASSAGATVLMSAAPKTQPANCVQGDGGELMAEPLARPDQTYVELDELIVTIGSSPSSRFLKMKIAIVTGKDKTQQIEEAELLLKDAFLKYLRSLEINDFEDPRSFRRMREQLALRAEVVLGGNVSNGILITEYLIR